MSNDEKLPLSVGSALERERERMVRLRESKEMTAPAKPTIDEQIEELGNPIRQLYPVRAEYRDAILATLRAHKAIMEAERPEPVAWMQSDYLHKLIAKHCGSQSTFARCSDHQLQLDYKPLYGPDLLAYADRMRAERDAAVAELESESLRRADSDLEVTKWRRWAEWAANKYFTTTGKTLEADNAA